MKNGWIVGVIIIALIAGVILLAGPKTGNAVNSPVSSGTNSNIKEFSMIAKQYAFVPNTITVNEGDTVLLHIKSIDVTHGIAIPQFGVNQQLEPGKEVTVKFVADKKGNFPFVCNVYCGEEHREMTGTVIVN